MSVSHKEDLSVLQPQIVTMQGIIDSLKQKQNMQSRPPRVSRHHTSGSVTFRRETLRRKGPRTGNSADRDSQEPSTSNSFKIVWRTQRSVTCDMLKECLASAHNVDPQSLCIKLTKRPSGSLRFTIAGHSQYINAMSSQWPD